MNDYLGQTNDFLSQMNDYLSQKNDNSSQAHIIIGQDNKYVCNICNIKTNHKSHYETHLLTSKHLKNLKYVTSNGVKTDVSHYDCLCGKSYKHRQGLFSHKKKCNYKQPSIKESICETNIIKELIKTTHQLILENNENKKQSYENDIVKELMKQNQSILLENQEFKTMLLDIVSKPSINNSNNTVHTNSHNKQFNLQFFLNDTCKNAMNMTDFMDSLEIKSSELEDMGRLGYVKGLSNIFIRALKELDEKERPMHCTDIKRETLYIKDNNVWEKETDDKMKLKKIIIYIADKNFRRIPKWKLDNPKSEDIMSKKHIEYMNMLSQVMSGISLDDETGTNKIIRNISNEICLNKKGYVDEIL